MTSGVLETAPPGRVRSYRRLAGGGVSTLSLLAGILAWEVIGRLWEVSFFPPFTEVLVSLGELVRGGDILGNLVTSLANLAFGFAISVLGGVVVGAAMGMFPIVNSALDTYVYALLTAPSLVFAPIFFSIFGLGRGSIIALVVMYAMFIIIINTADGVRAVPRDLVEMARSYNASNLQMLRAVIIPAALPMIMAGLRLGVSRAVKGMINGEMFIAVVGLGRVVTEAGGRFDAAAVLAVLLVIIAVAWAASGVVRMVDARLTSWLPSVSRT